MTAFLVPEYILAWPILIPILLVSGMLVSVEFLNFAPFLLN